MDWKEEARKKHKEEKEKAKKRLKERVIEHLQRDRTDMSGWGVGQGSPYSELRIAHSCVSISVP